MFINWQIEKNYIWVIKPNLKCIFHDLLFQNEKMGNFKMSKNPSEQIAVSRLKSVKMQ